MTAADEKATLHRYLQMGRDALLWKLDATGTVSWWPPERRTVTLQQILVHNVAETHRHAGHADLVRELIDGTIGLRRDVTNTPPNDQSWWSTYHQQVEDAARAASPS